MSLPRKPAKPREPLNETGLYDYAVKALGRRMRRVPVEDQEVVPGSERLMGGL
jgi:hypothetical protein